jgi:hypothetical protein
MKKHIKFGKFERSEWELLHGLGDPTVKSFMKCIDFMDWSRYELYAHGGILEDRLTADIDLTIIGPKNPKQVNFMLETCVACGFNYGIYADIKYLYDGELFDHQEWLDTGEYVTNIYASYAPEIYINGETFKYAVDFEGFWLAEQSHPLGKVRDLDMPSPKQII